MVTAEVRQAISRETNGIHLTNREKEVLSLIAGGLSGRENQRKFTH